MKKYSKLEKSLIGIAIGAAVLLVAVIVIALVTGVMSKPQDALQVDPTHQTGITDGVTEPVENTQPEETENQDPAAPQETVGTGETVPQNTSPNEPAGTENKDTQDGNPQGGNTQGGNPGGKDDPVQPTVAPTQPPAEEPLITLSDPNLFLEALGGYSGNYLEDGTDEVVSNVAAIRITNTSDQMLQVAQIVFQVSEGEVARFQITNLPAGGTVLALEMDRRIYSKSEDYSYGKTASAYLEAPTLAEDRVKLDTSKDGKLTLENISGQTLAEVYVYYKYVQFGGDYLGGITYVVPFKDVAPGQVLTVDASHFRSDNSQIVNVDIVTE